MNIKQELIKVALTINENKIINNLENCLKGFIYTFKNNKLTFIGQHIFTEQLSWQEWANLQDYKKVELLKRNHLNPYGFLNRDVFLELNKALTKTREQEIDFLEKQLKEAKLIVKSYNLESSYKIDTINHRVLFVIDDFNKDNL